MCPTRQRLTLASAIETYKIPFTGKNNKRGGVPIPANAVRSLRLRELGGLVAVDMAAAAIVPMGEAQSAEFAVPIYFRVERIITGKWSNAVLLRATRLDPGIAILFHERSEFT